MNVIENNKSCYQVLLHYLHIPNNTKPCVTSHCVCPSTYEHSTCTTHEYDVSQCKDRIDFYLVVPSSAFKSIRF